MRTVSEARWPSVANSGLGSNSCLYEGVVRHRRFQPVSNEFTYRVVMLYLDFAELDRVFEGRWLWSADRPAIAWFRRSDYLSEEDVRHRVARETGSRPAGPIRILTNPRYFGYVFNPVTFYYCFSTDGVTLETIVAEITNTPWKERHCYVLPASASVEPAPVLRFRFGKTFHVSPFFPMHHDYDWRFGEPGGNLSVHMENLDGNRRVFDATMTLRRREIGAAALAGALARFPLMTMKVAAAIYWQALRLWWKGAPFFAHPKGETKC